MLIIIIIGEKIFAGQIFCLNFATMRTSPFHGAGASLFFNHYARKMKTYKHIALAALMLCSAQGGFAVKAYPGLIKARQADGTEISIRLHGSEHGNYATTADGFPVIFNEATGNYEYATISGSRLVASGMAAADAARRTPQAVALLSSVDRQAAADMAMGEARKRSLIPPEEDGGEESGRKTGKGAYEQLSPLRRAALHCNPHGICRQGVFHHGRPETVLQ